MTKEEHIANGRACGIPECCIAYFVRTVERTPTALFSDLLFGYAVNPPLTNDGEEYVLCPECRAKCETIEPPEYVWEQLRLYVEQISYTWEVKQ